MGDSLLEASSTASPVSLRGRQDFGLAPFKAARKSFKLRGNYHTTNRCGPLCGCIKISSSVQGVLVSCRQCRVLNTSCQAGERACKTSPKPSKLRLPRRESIQLCSHYFRGSDQCSPGPVGLSYK